MADVVARLDGGRLLLTVLNLALTQDSSGAWVYPAEASIAGGALGGGNMLIVAGQSNAGGRGTGAYPGFSPTSKVKIWNGSAFVTYTPGSASRLSCDGTFDGAWGAEAEYARLFVESGGEQLYIVKAHYDSTSLAIDWNPAGSANRFDQASAIIAAARAAIVAAGETPQARELFWMQGEQDATDAAAAANYQTNLTALVAAMRADWGIEASTPIAIGRIAQNPAVWTYQAGVTAGEKAVADADAFVTLVNTNDAPLDSGDDLHYGPIGLKVIGERLWGIDRGSYIFAEATPAVLNGTFATGIEYWTGQNISWDGSGKIAHAAINGTGFTGFVTGLTIGDLYDLSFTADAFGQGLMAVTKAGGVGLVNAYVNESPVTLQFTAERTVHQIVWSRTVAGSVVRFDNFAVAEGVVPVPALTMVNRVGTSVTVLGASEARVAPTVASGFGYSSATQGEALTGDFLIRFQPLDDGDFYQLMAGVTSDPVVDNEYQSIDYGLYLVQTQPTKIYENGVAGANLSGYVANECWFIRREGTTLRIGHGGNDGTTGYTESTTRSGVGGDLYVKTIFNDINGRIDVARLA